MRYLLWHPSICVSSISDEKGWSIVGHSRHEVEFNHVILRASTSYGVVKKLVYACEALVDVARVEAGSTFYSFKLSIGNFQRTATAITIKQPPCIQ